MGTDWLATSLHQSRGISEVHFALGRIAIDFFGLQNYTELFESEFSILYVSLMIIVYTGFRSMSVYPDYTKEVSLILISY